MGANFTNLTRGKRNKDLLTAELIKQPLATKTELAKAVGVNRSVVTKHWEEMKARATKDDRVVSLTDDDWEIQKLIQNFMKLFLKKLKKVLIWK
jgi:hypothetical protein